MAASTKGPIELITNNFKIKSQNRGIINTYRVDFIEGQKAKAEQLNTLTENPEDQSSNVSRGSIGSLETFQKYKIINAHTEKLK